MKLSDMRKKSPAQLDKHVESLKGKLEDYYRERLTKDIKDNKLARNLRIEISRALTVKTELIQKERSNG